MWHILTFLSITAMVIPSYPNPKVYLVETVDNNVDYSFQKFGCVTHDHDVETLTDFDGIVTHSWEECHKMCTELHDCTHWAWRSDEWSHISRHHGKKNGCFRKISTGKLIFEKGMITGPRHCESGFENGSDNDGGDYSQMTEVPESLVVSSNGGAARAQWDKMGIFKLQDLYHNNFPVWKKEGVDCKCDEQFLFVNGKNQWIFGDDLKSDVAGIHNTKRNPTPSSPLTNTNDWTYWEYTEWKSDNTFRIEAVGGWSKAQKFVWGDDECPDMVILTDVSVDQCKKECEEQGGMKCTAINYGINGINKKYCTLRQCEFPVNSPKIENPNYEGYFRLPLDAHVVGTTGTIYQFAADPVRKPDTHFKSTEEELSAGVWSGWSACTVTCNGGGTMKRICTNPKPISRYAGLGCPGENMMSCGQTPCGNHKDIIHTPKEMWTAKPMWTIKRTTITPKAMWTEKVTQQPQPPKEIP